MNCMRCGQALEERDICPTCGFVQSKAEETILGWYDDAQRAEDERRYEIAAEYYKNAADMGLLAAQLAYGRLLESGRGVKKSIERAKEYYRSAAAYGEAEAALALSKLLKNQSAHAEDGKSTENAAFFLRVAAELGSAEAQYLLAEAYRHGDIPSEGEAQVAYWYAESAKAGYPDAAIKAGELYLSGGVSGATEEHAKWFFEQAQMIGNNRVAARYLSRLRGIEAKKPPEMIPVNHPASLCDLAQSAERAGDNAIAFSLYGLSAESGYVRALYRLGLCYENAIGTLMDMESAVSYYQQAADGGSIEALLQLASCYRYGRGTAPDEAKAFSYYLKAAEKSNPRAQYIVGECYLNGELTAQNLRLAIMWLERAAIKGHHEAISSVNALHETMSDIYNQAIEYQNNGDGAEALRLYIMLSEMGHAAAQCNAGFCYQTGFGCTKDAKRAISYYRAAAESGSTVAKYNLALCYSRGIGTRLDFIRARELLLECQKEGYRPATDTLEQMNRQHQAKIGRRLYSASTVVYRRGDVEEAIRILVEAAKHGSLRATYMLACHFEFGDGVPRDMERADALYAAAAAAGLDASHGNLKNGYMRERKLLELSKKH